jgi:DNA-directed RNA polymerase III subunit RPC8
VSNPYHPFVPSSDPQERSHFWIADPDTAAAHSSLLDIPTADRMYIDTGEVLRIRVEADEFVDEEPGPPKAAEGVRVERVAMRAPYAITVGF